MPQNRPALPEPMKRLVRQRCGFGCVICGLPIYDYDHIVEWSEVKEHTANNLTLLCQQHHAEKRKGLLPLEQIVKANLDPINMQSGVSSPYGLHYGKDAPRCEVVIVRNAFSRPLEADTVRLIGLVVDGIVLLGFNIEAGQILLQLRAFNIYNEPVIQVRDNELIYSAKEWDITFASNKLMIREGPGQILLDVSFEPPGRIRVNRGAFYCNGVQLEMNKYGIAVTGAGSGRTVIEDGTACGNAESGIIIGPNLANVQRGFLQCEQVPRFLRQDPSTRH